MGFGIVVFTISRQLRVYKAPVGMRRLTYSYAIVRT